MNLKKFFSDDNAVSPVIGVILMVAITVILAAVIAAFVLDLGQGMETEAQAATSISASGDTVTVTWSSEGNSDDLDVTAEVLTSDYSVVGTTTDNLGSVGSSTSFQIEHDSGGSGDAEVRITVVANSGDSETMIQQTTKTVTVS